MARSQSEATAVVSDAGAVTYGVLNRRANRLARYLRRAGVTAETRVGICLTRGIETLVALLAVLKAGGAYVPLATDTSRDRLRAIAAHARMVLVLVDRRTKADAAGCGVATFDIDGEWSCIAGEPDDDPMWSVHPDALAYAIHTSGSTGEPKVVAIPHRGLVNILAHVRDMVGLGADDRWLAVTPDHVRYRGAGDVRTARVGRTGLDGGRPRRR